MKIFLKIILGIMLAIMVLFIINEIQIYSNCKLMIKTHSVSSTLTECVRVYTFGGDYFGVTPIKD